jgi:uncharacterized protein YbaR (Trm112 family)
MKVSIDPELLEILACPACHGDVRENGGNSGLECLKCRLRYPVRDGIPVMLLDEAEKMADEPE